MARELDLDELVAPATATATATTPATARVTAATEAKAATATDRKAVRTTVDLRADEYEQFLDWCSAAAKETDRPRVHGQQVVRVLVRRLLTDQRLARQVTADLRKHAGQLNSTY